MMNLNKSSVLADKAAKVKVGATTKESEKNIYTAILIAVPILIVGSILFPLLKY